ncbi:3'-5' exonuclease [Vibrio genomosp. F10 str. 9ZC157]|uniref:DNA-directed DNA polymerase n=1 Tax=Vibrio genomosp. F10 str. ZF-129 TaxID=1187848 RepID=A0A1E5BCR8_9VIBR|nr:3'-5' exonuclease [Vibrio genomosp. F10]OEE32626.1 DNA polymerase III subunit epsilon [Vibrio genomosp. F10 str. ZF-129]OEE96546.1 DNA polymerase III subunit epsilon [Vibrio genomosp. F10 str. 9ZC157]
MNSFIRKPAVDWALKFKKHLAMAKHPVLTHFYQQSIPDATTPIGEIEFLAVDFETTGLDPKKDDIITVGVVPFTLNRIYLNRARHWTVRPRKQLSEESVVIHGITHSDIIDAPDLTEVIEEILECLSGRILVVHYHRIEREFLDRALRTRFEEGIEFPVVDTMQIESRIQAQWAGGFWNRLKGKKPQSVRLGQSRIRYHLPTYTPHHALTDAIATAELLQAQISYHYDPNQPVRDFWI